MWKTRIAKKSDIEAVLRLQEKNLLQHLNEEERKGGFVTTPFSVPQIEKILEQNGLFIAEDELQHVIAYAFAGSWTYFQQWDIFKMMISRLPNLSFQGNSITVNNSFQYGPVCIEKKYRGKGVLPHIFEEMRTEFCKKYSISITFINQVNQISEKAHLRLGWEIIDEFEWNGNRYFTLAFDMHNSTLKKEF